MITESEIEEFVANLRASLFEAMATGQEVTLSVKHDTEMEDPPGYSGKFGEMPEYRYFGRTITMKIGRPAAKERVANEAEKQKLENCLALRNQPCP